MNISIAKFIDEYINGEPLTTDTISYAIKKYLYINYKPTKQEKYDTYRSLLWDIAKAAKANDTETISKLITNIKNWAYARSLIEGIEPNEYIALKNETFYNLRKLN